MAAPVLLSNLTRWRNLTWDWITTLTEVQQSFREEIYIGDQDIINIILSEVSKWKWNYLHLHN